MYDRLYSFLEKKESLYEHQFGFRNNCSTTHAPIEITENIRKSCNKVFALFWRFGLSKKPFDTANHKILLSKLKYYGIREKAYDWFSSFIHNRQQFISIDEQNSELNKISHGVSQGTILDPLLFTIFINNLHYAATHSNVRHFADDTNLLFANKSL